MSKPVVVCISDIHFTVQNLELCSKALKSAIDKSNELKIPLVIAGDLNDTKAVIRAEVANRLIELLKTATQKVYILVGNHDLVNEKGSDNGLNYLKPYASIIDLPLTTHFGIKLVPYYNDAAELKDYLSRVPSKGDILIMHQGFLGAAMGDYIQDKTSVDPTLVKDFTVISGHYHRHQTIGTVTYIGSPFTMSYGEANDGLKGFLIVNEDGTFTREILGLRKHVCLNRTIDCLYDTIDAGADDLVWLKVTGIRSELAKIDKTRLGSVRLDLIPIDSPEYQPLIQDIISNSDLFDSIIDNLTDSDDYKSELKCLWRDLIQ